MVYGAICLFRFSSPGYDISLITIDLKGRKKTNERQSIASPERPDKQQKMPE